MVTSNKDAQNKRISRLRGLLKERILVIDGAMGTAIQGFKLNAEDFGGPQYEGCNEYLVITRPDVIQKIHQGYLDAGADILETDTFGSTSVVLAEYKLGHLARELNQKAAQLARELADAASTPDKPRFVAGSMGPTTKTISVTGGITWDALADAYQEQAEGLIEGGVDVLLLETTQDTLNLKAGLVGIERANKNLGTSVPAAVQGTVEPMGTLLAGQDVEALYTSVEHLDLLWIGLNCATGPDFMTDHIRTLARISKFPVSCVPNAGLPDEDGRYNQTPEMLSKTVGRFEDEGWVNLVGGCCGTVPEHIKLLAKSVQGKTPRHSVYSTVTRVSGIEALTIDQDTRPIIVGERTNVLGSRRFKQIIADGKYEEGAELGRQQVKRGAHLLDVCLQDPDRNEMDDIIKFLEILVKKTKVPIMIDSTDARVIEQALKRTQGKSVINSINLEDGETRFQAVVPLAKRFGAALVVGCIDEDKKQAQAITRQRKLEIAQRSYKLLTEKYGIAPEDIIFDLLVFPVGTGDKNYIGSAVETIEGTRLVKQAMPRSKTILGISNVSFGLPTAGREVLNAVMLYHCVQAGLDMAIVNSEALKRYLSIPEAERVLAEDLIWWRGADPIGAFAAHFRNAAKTPVIAQKSNMTLDERLASYIIEGTKEGLTSDLEEALKSRKPLDIINGPLMAGMDEVGRRFNANQMIVAEVLQSAESMKAAVGYLEPHMDKDTSSSKGKIILATVKGDVHDIGKNLVEIILSNNGFQVINLGINVPPQELINAYQKHSPDFVGLSGLLVKSAQMMVVTAQDLAQAGVSCPILVGGAALTNKFTRLRIAPEYKGLVAYARDAMSGLALANRLREPAERQKIITELETVTKSFSTTETVSSSNQPADDSTRLRVRQDHPIPPPPDLKLHVISDFDLNEIFSYINPMMLYVRHLGYKGRFDEAMEAGEPKALELREAVREVEDAMVSRPDIKAKAVFKFFPANSEGNDILVYDASGEKVLERFRFGRQSQGDGLCLADFVLPRTSGKKDYLAMFITTIGPGVRALADKWKDEGSFLKSHILQALGLEGAEAFAELLHKQIRKMWGIGEPDNTPKEEMFKAHYQGKRYSFGYPACPRLEDQAQLFRLLEPEKHIGARLTEGYMMDPEGSVSAIVFHHPDAKYFNLSSEDAARLEKQLNGN